MSEVEETAAERAARKEAKRARKLAKETAEVEPSSARPRTRSFDRTSPAEVTTSAASAWLGATVDSAVSGSKRRARGDSEAANATALAPVSASAGTKRARVEPPSRGGNADEEDEDEEAEAADEEADAEETVAAPTSRALTSFRMDKQMVAALESRGVKALFPIQERTFDTLYDGADLIGRARTGMGKTLAFVLPIVSRLKQDPAAATARGRKPRVIVMAPTRELAKQVGEDFISVAGNLVTLVVYGGTGLEPQKGALWKGVDILVGTPGRIQDLMEGKHLKLDAVKFVVSVVAAGYPAESTAGACSPSPLPLPETRISARTHAFPRPPPPLSL